MKTYHYITKDGEGWIKAVNPFEQYPDLESTNSSEEYLAFILANPPLKWVGDKLPEGTVLREEEIDPDWFQFKTKDSKYWSQPHHNESLSALKLNTNYHLYEFRQAARLKSQLTQREGEPEAEQLCKYCHEKGFNSGGFCLHCGQREQPVNGEEAICSVNCNCKSGEDCNGESALNLIDLVEQQDRIAEIVEFIKDNLNTREEEVINLISDKYRITLIKDANI